MSTNNLPPTPPPRAYANSTQPPKPPPKLSSLLYGKGVNGNSVTSPPTTSENNENTSPPSSSSPSTITTTEADIDNTNDSSNDQQVLDSNQTDIIVESEDKVTLSIDSPNNLHSRITSEDNLENFANKFAMNSLNTLGSVSDSHFRKRSTSDMDTTDSSSSPTLHESISSNGSFNVNSNSLDSPIIPRLDLEETLQSPTIINFDDDETTESSSAMDDDEASTVTTPKATIDKDKAVSILGEHIPQLLTRVRFFNFIRRDPSLKKARKRQELIKETIETEKTYVQNLKSFLNLYYQPLIENRDHGKGVLKSQSELQVLFANINQISNINQTLLSDLEKANPETKIEVKEESLPSPTSSTSSQVSANSTSTPNGSGDLTSPRTVGFVIKRKDDPNLAKKNQPSSYRIYDSIGKPFGHLVPFLKVYTTYINNHDRATEMFEKMKKSNKKFKEFLTECYAMQKGIKSDFCSFLILPIQRIPRYKMLLSEILTNTPEEHAEFENLQKVVNEIEKIASYINEQKRNFDNVRYMYEIYNMIEPIYPGFVQPNRKFLRKASFHVKYRQVKAQRNSTALPTPPINTSDSKNSGSMTPRSLPSVPPKNPSATTAPPVITSGGKRVLPPPVPGKQPDSFSNVLAQMTGSNKLLNLKALYNEGRFTIYQFTDMLVLIEEKNESDESSSGLSAFQSFTRKATMFGKKKEQSTPTNSDSTKSKYHQLTLTVGKNLHFIFFHFIDTDAFFGNSNNSNVVTTSGGKSLPVPPPKRGFYDVIDECDIPIRVITKGSQYEYILTTSTTGDRDEWKESLGNCISDICNVKIYANRGVSLQNSSEMYKLGKERAAVHTQAKENLKFHQQIQQEHMLLQVRTVQVSSEIQQKKELLATLQREIAELEQEKQDKEKRLDVIKEEKGQVREKITTLWQDLQQKDKTALKLLHEEKEAFKHVFGCEFGEELSFKAPSSSTSTSGSGSTATNNNNEKNNNSPLAPGQVNSDLMEQLMKVKANAEANKNPQVSEKKSSLLKSIIGDSKSRKVTIKHTQFIENQLKAVHSPSNKTSEPNNTSESTPTKN